MTGETIDLKDHRAPAPTDKVALDPDGYTTAQEIAELANIQGPVTGADSINVGNRNTAGNAHSIGEAIGADNTAAGFAPRYSGDGGVLGSAEVALGYGNVSDGLQSVAVGIQNYATRAGATAIGGFNIIDTQGVDFSDEQVSVGHYNYVSGDGAVAYGLQCAATGQFGVAIGGRTVAAGYASTAVGGGFEQLSTTTRACGEHATAIGANARADANLATAVGYQTRVGNPERAFTIAANGTVVTIPGGNFTNEFVNGDTVMCTLGSVVFDALGGASAQRQITGVTFNSGPNTTTFTINVSGTPTALPLVLDGTAVLASLAPGDPLPHIAPTAGYVVAQTQGQRSGAFGYNDVVSAADAYAFGEGLTNSVAGSVLLGSTGKIVNSNGAFGALGLTGATQASRYCGATASGAPVSGTFAVGDFIIDRTAGSLWVCTAAGTPGTWTQSAVNAAPLAQAAQTPPQEPVQGARTPQVGTLPEAARADHDHAFPLILGAGPPTGVTAPKGWLYSNTTATTTTTRLYVNTDGGTTWTNLTTAA